MPRPLFLPLFVILIISGICQAGIITLTNTLAAQDSDNLITPRSTDLIKSVSETESEARGRIRIPGAFGGCNGRRLVAHPEDDNKYIRCVRHPKLGKDTLYYFVLKCPPGNSFNQARMMCVVEPTTNPASCNDDNSQEGNSSGSVVCP